jgi:hypothetical protein
MPQRPSFYLFCIFFFFLNSGSPVLVTLFLCIGMALMGLLMVLWELSCRNCFLPTFVIREPLAFNTGIIGAAPMIAILATHYSLTYVGFI